MKAGWVIEKDWVSGVGFRCVIVRGGWNKHRCGYVAVPAGHPLNGVGYSEGTVVLGGAWEKALDGPVGKRGILSCVGLGGGPAGSGTPEGVFDVHGSLTYSGADDGYPVAAGDGSWWFGFDCAHAGDDFEGGQPLSYVISECESLAAQLAEVKPEAGDV